MKRAWTLMVPGIFAFLLACSIDVHAQQPADLNGDYVGTLGPLSLKLHITAAPDGSLSGTLDSPNQGANGIPCSDFRIDGRRLSFKVPAVNGTRTGTIDGFGSSFENGGEYETGDSEVSLDGKSASEAGLRRGMVVTRIRGRIAVSRARGRVMGRPAHALTGPGGSRPIEGPSTGLSRVSRPAVPPSRGRRAAGRWPGAPSRGRR